MKIDERDERTPLAWPEGFPRTKLPESSSFGKHTANGYVRSAPSDKGVAIYFSVRGSYDPKSKTTSTTSYVIPCDRWDKIEHNFWAIAKHLEAMRGQRRWGCGSLERDFMGYKAISNGETSWHGILGVKQTDTWEQVQDAFRIMAMKAHPDCGGSHEGMLKLNRAFEEAKTFHGR